MSISLEESLAVKIRQIAIREDRTMSKIIERLCLKGLKKEIRR